MAESKKPDYRATISKKTEDGYSYGMTVGVAWKNKSGGINWAIPEDVDLVLRGGVHSVTFWPNEDREERAPRGGRDDDRGRW